MAQRYIGFSRYTNKEEEDDGGMINHDNLVPLIIISL